MVIVQCKEEKYYALPFDCVEAYCTVCSLCLGQVECYDLVIYDVFPT